MLWDESHHHVELTLHKWIASAFFLASAYFEQASVYNVCPSIWKNDYLLIVLHTVFGIKFSDYCILIITIFLTETQYRLINVSNNH